MYKFLFISRDYNNLCFPCKTHACHVSGEITKIFSPKFDYFTEFVKVEKLAMKSKIKDYGCRL